MASYDVKIRIEAETPDRAVLLGNLIQNAVVNIDRNDLVKLLTKVKNDPGIVKTALKWI
jgi:hypothetical protein